MSLSEPRVEVEDVDNVYHQLSQLAGFRLFGIFIQPSTHCSLLEYLVPGNIGCCFQIFGYFLEFLAFLWHFWRFFGFFGCFVAFLAFLWLFWFFVAFLCFSSPKIVKYWRITPVLHLETPRPCGFNAVPSSIASITAQLKSGFFVAFFMAKKPKKAKTGPPPF